MSINIDGDDYPVFQTLHSFSPRVVLIEYNPTISPHIELVAPPGNYFGASALGICNLAKEKGYSLAVCTVTNLIFVRNVDFDKFGITVPKLMSVMPMNHLTYVFTSYDGTASLSREPVSRIWKHLFSGLI